MCDPNTLREQAHLSLKDRAKLFHRKFPDRVIKPKDYSKILKWNGIKRKKVRTINMPQRKDYLAHQYATKTIQL